MRKPWLRRAIWESRVVRVDMPAGTVDDSRNVCPGARKVAVFGIWNQSSDC